MKKKKMIKRIEELAEVVSPYIELSKHIELNEDSIKQMLSNEGLKGIYYVHSELGYPSCGTNEITTSSDVYVRFSFEHKMEIKELEKWLKATAITSTVINT